MNNLQYRDVVHYWQEHSKTNADELNRMLSNFWVLLTCHSNNIEDGKLDYHVTREVFSGSKITIAGVYPKDIVEAQNRKYVRREIVNLLLKKEPISPVLIKEIHRIYMSGLYDDSRYENGERPGEYKINNYCVGITEEGSLPENVEQDIVKLCKEINGAEKSKILTVAAYFHLVFESIHPFSDGNGRLGRMLMNYLLMLYSHPINIFNEDKETYYMALEVFDRTGEISGFYQVPRRTVCKDMERFYRIKY